jgi:hypothetical protein
MVALTGLAGAAVPLLRPPPDARTLAVLIPLFDHGRTMKVIFQSGLPIFDLRLDGHLVVLGIQDGGPDAATLRAAGLVTIASSPPPSCLNRNVQS